MPAASPRHYRRLFIAIPACLAIILLFRACSYPAENALIGKNETTIQSRYGQPTNQFAGHYGLPKYAWTKQFKGQIKTAVYSRLAGKLYVTYENQSGQ